MSISIWDGSGHQVLDNTVVTICITNRETQSHILLHLLACLYHEFLYPNRTTPTSVVAVSDGVTEECIDAVVQVRCRDSHDGSRGTEGKILHHPSRVRALAEHRSVVVDVCDLNV